MAKFPNTTSIPSSSPRPRGNAYFRCKTNLVNLDPLRFAWIVDTGLYKACCAQRCCSYAADECSNVVDARYWVFEDTL